MLTASFRNLVKYDFIVFFREPFFALPILLLPGIFFYVFMSIFKMQAGSVEGFDIYIPTYGLLISFLVLFFNMGMQFVTEKENGVHKRLILSSINKKHIVYAYLIRGITLSFIGLVEICLIAKLAFDMEMTKYFFSFLLGYLLIIFLLLLISISVHDLFKSTKQVLPFTIITFQYVLFGSGLMFPVSSAPEFLKVIIYINPFYHMNKILVSLWKGHLNNIPLSSIVYLLVITIGCFSLVRYNSLKKES
ncbi:ABC transporter permease [Enterococcus faecium]|uniref:ABC transporter permease n=1 Tax=Enterococcus TaxID=1350 RepID=UPI00223B218A|nr:ABC transporter permease [Enterococcus faecium]MCS8591440.1 ABC transporter permease [Enterococcus faecium]